MEFLKHIRLMAKQVYPSEFAEVIYETDIISVFAYRCRRRTPHIREYKF
jgi:hypothetical protein